MAEEENYSAPNTLGAVDHALPSEPPPERPARAHINRWLVVGWWMGLGLPLAALLIGVSFKPSWTAYFLCGSIAAALVAAFILRSYSRSHRELH